MKMAPFRHSMVLLVMAIMMPSLLAARHSQHASMKFIKASCSTTLYSKLCLSTLSPHANSIQADPVRLADTALNLTTSATMSSLVVVTRMASDHGGMKPMEVAAFRDCVEMMGEAVDELRRSSDVMAHIGGQTLGDQVGNMQTWVSAALTNGNTCADGLLGHSAHSTRRGVVKVVKMTSNTLCFINSLVAH